MSRPWLPPLLLALYALGFGWKTLGSGLLAFDDHPGQLYRIAHALTVGLAPWRWNPGWWAGYAELQFYPPGFAYAGAAVHHASLGALSVFTVYQVLLWVTYLLPGATTYALLARGLGSPWLALPGGFLALTLSAGSRSGVEEGMRWGLVAARLGWGLLPLLALALVPWVEGRSRAPLRVAILLAAVILTHPAHAPAAVVLVLLAARHAPAARSQRLSDAGLLLALGGGLTGFWLVPLLAHLRMALPLAWGEASLGALARSVAERPLLVLLAVACGLVWWQAGRPGSLPPAGRWLAGFAPATALVIAADALVAQPLGVVWLPADRLLDGLLLALILDASLGLLAVQRSWRRVPAWGLALASIALCIGLGSWYRGEPSLTLWPRPDPNAWPKYGSIAAGLRLEQLWEALRSAPPGRILFIRSGVPLDYRGDWRRPHTHITALTPLYSGREILGGTFTHPSPVAGLVYTGSSANQPITMLAEQRDGKSLFGQPLERLSADDFNRLAARLRISAVVALDEDEGRLRFVTENPAFGRPARIGPFRVFTSREPRPVPTGAGAQRRTLPLPAHAGGWTPAGMAWSPLWEARMGAERLGVRRDELGLLEVNAPGGSPVAIQLEHRPGVAEWTGMALSGTAALAMLAVAARRRRQRSPA